MGPTGLRGADWVTLPEHFKRSGFLTLGHGKLYHPNKPPNWDQPRSWSQLQPYGKEHVTGCDAANFCPSAAAPAALSDFNTTLEAIATLQRMRAWATANATPFFLGVGMHFPHQPWATRAAVLDAYPAASALPPPRNAFSPRGGADVAFTAELDGDDHIAMDFGNPILGNASRDPALPANATGRQSYAVPSPGNNTVPGFFTQYMRLGYYTAVSTSDEHFGMMMDALDASGLANSTIVALLGDHGWQLGEHTLFGKHTNFDLSAHVPLLMRVPGKAASSAGRHTETVVELLDLYRTLGALAGAPVADADVEGKDFSAAFDAPEQQLFDEAYAQYSRCPGERYFPNVSALPDWALNNCEDVPAPNITFMGYSVRTLEWRLTQWFAWDGAACAPRWDAPPHAVELYSHAGHDDPGDFDGWENDNVAGANAPVVAALELKLRARFQRARGAGCPPDAPGSLEYGNRVWEQPGA